MRSPEELRQSDHDRIAREVAEFLERGGTIEAIPRGVSGDNLTPRQRINPDTRILREEREAKKRAERAIPRPREVRQPKPRKAPDPKAERRRGGPPQAMPGTMKARILEVLAAGPVSTAFIAGALGITRPHASTHLGRLKARGRVRLYGTDPTTYRWGLACP